MAAGDEIRNQLIGQGGAFGSAGSKGGERVVADLDQRVPKPSFEIDRCYAVRERGSQSASGPELRNGIVWISFSDLAFYPPVVVNSHTRHGLQFAPHSRKKKLGPER